MYISQRIANRMNIDKIFALFKKKLSSNEQAITIKVRR